MAQIFRIDHQESNGGLSVDVCRCRFSLNLRGKAAKRNNMQQHRAANKQFESFSASELYCPRCRMAQPVRERLLLVTPAGEIHEYRCKVCSESLGTRDVTARRPAEIVR